MNRMQTLLFHRHGFEKNVSKKIKDIQTVFYHNDSLDISIKLQGKSKGIE